jgi:TIR domain
MIFLSHNHADKPVVEPVAIRLRAIFGQDKVFYDSWSIQPGDSIVERMNAGLTDVDFVFFFVSTNSLRHCCPVKN